MRDRRYFLTICSQFGLTSTLFPGVLWALADKKKKISADMIDAAAVIAGVTIPDHAKSMMVKGLNEGLKGIGAVHELKLPNRLPPALIFNPLLPGMTFESQRKSMKMSEAPTVIDPGTPRDLETLAFATVRELAEYIRTRRISSMALTQMYLERLRRYDPVLKFVVSIT